MALSVPLKRVFVWLLIAALLLAAVMLLSRVLNPGSSFTLPGTPDPALKDQDAQVHFIDVGQADSTLLLQGRSAALIDAGTTADGPLIAAYLKAQGVRSLDYLVLTHFHADHIGGALHILQEFAVDAVLLPDLELGPMPTSSTALRLLEALTEQAEADRIRVVLPAVGDVYPFGSGTLETVGAGLACKDDLNNTSLITLFHFDNFSCYIGGDAEAEAELALLASGQALHADLLKVPHHGSYTSCTPELAQQLQPLAAVISCGYGNDYGHPHSVTLNTLEIAGARIFRTDVHGTVVAKVKNGVMTLRGEKGGWPYAV